MGRFRRFRDWKQRSGKLPRLLLLRPYKTPPAAAAGAHAKWATTTLDAFMNTTGVVTTAHGNIFSRLGQVEANGKGAIDLVNVIMRLVVQRGSPPSVPSPTSSSVDMSSLFSKEQINTMFARRDTDIERVRQLLKGGGFTTGVGTFESVTDTDVEVFVATHFPSETVFECLMDINVDLCSLQHATLDLDDVRLSEVHAEKTGRNNNQLMVAASFGSETPAFLAGPKEGRDSSVHFGAFKTHADWDRQDGQNGCRHKLGSQLERRRLVVENLIGTKLRGHPQAQLLCRELVTNTMTFFREMAAMMSTLYLLLINKAYGSEGKASKA